MNQTKHAVSNSLTLDEVIARLSQRTTVEGMLTIGTTSGERLTPAGVFHPVFVLSELPEGLEPYGVTYIDSRLTDLLLNYLDIRNLAWHGDKEAVRCLMAHGPAYLARSQAVNSEAG